MRKHHAPFGGGQTEKQIMLLAGCLPYVVHHALCNVIEPIFERAFIADSYANRVGKGTHRALDRAQHFARRYPYVLQCDIRQFFPSIDHAILRATLARYVDDACGAGTRRPHPGQRRGRARPTSTTRNSSPATTCWRRCGRAGCPSATSPRQTWANFYLNSLDHFVKRDLKCPAYVRYCDDFLLFGDDKAALHEWKAGVQNHLAGLRLSLNIHKAHVYPVRTGIPFLGFHVWPTYRRLHADNVRLARRRLQRQHALVLAGRLSHARLQESLRAWAAHAAHADTWRLRRRLLAKLVFSRAAR